MRLLQALQVSCVSVCTAKVLNKWFCDFEQLLLQQYFLNNYSKSNHIWNCDEKWFPICLATRELVNHITGITGSR